MNIVALNGEFLEMDKARIPVSDAGFMLGDGVFETIRAEQGHLLFAHEHFARLAKGARTLGIPFLNAEEDLLATCQAVLDANELKFARLRVTLSRGPLRNQPMTAGEGEPTVAITAIPLDLEAEEERRERGLTAMVSSVARNHRSPLSRIKPISYGDSSLARREAIREGSDEALMLNCDGFVAEAAMANVFIIRDGRVQTPRIEDGALPGVMRAHVMRLCAKLDFAVDEISFEAADVAKADEAFLTNAIQQVMPLISLDGRRILDGYPGPRTQKIFAAHRELIEAELRRQSW